MVAIMAALALNVASAGVDRLMQPYAGDVPGATVIVIHNGDVALRKTYGLADVEQHIAVTSKTNFRLASVTKQFTAASIEILAERGRLSYDDPIGRFLPSLPACARVVTIRQLLTHTGGLPDYEDLIPQTATKQVSDADVLHLIEQTAHTYFAPGTSYRYSNTGYVLLGLIVAKVSGQTFPQFLEQEIFGPLKMRGSVMHVEGVSKVLNRAYGYAFENDRFVRRDQSITSATVGDGGVYTSIDDLVKWDHALEHATLVKRETIRLAFTPATATDDPAIRYGFGWRISDHDGHRAIWHSGETVSFRDVIVRFPDDHLTVVVLTNRDDPEPYKTALAIADLLLR
jgi:CubicO group peptidase (beta-lactamase class C family)